MLNQVVIDVATLYTGMAKISELPNYKAAALEQAGNGNYVTLTGPGPVWLYLSLAHALHGKAMALNYESPASGAIEIFNHDPF